MKRGECNKPKRRRKAAFSFARPDKLAHTVAKVMTMTIFKCPHCSAEYEMIMTHISFRQLSYANCQVCWKPMYSWASTKVPRFTLLVQPDNTPRP